MSLETAQMEATKKKDRRQEELKIFVNEGVTEGAKS